MSEDKEIVGKKEVLTLLDSTQVETTIVQLVKHKDSKYHALTHQTAAALARAGNLVEAISRHTYSLMGLKANNATNFGTAIPCGKGVWLVAKHVVGPCLYARVSIPPEEFVDAAHFPSACHLVLNNLISENDYHVLNDLWPLFQSEKVKKEELSDFDFCLYRALEGVPEVEAIFPEGESRQLKTGDDVFICSYPGYDHHQLTVEHTLDAVFGKHPKKPTYAQTKERFHGFGKKCASFGEVLAVNASIVSNNCSVFSGSSGGIMKRVSDNSVTFTGIHKGGDFYQESGTAYNYAVLAHHPSLVVLYAKFIYPLYKPDIPEQLMSYFRANTATIKKYHDFIGNDLALLL